MARYRTTVIAYVAGLAAAWVVAVDAAERIEVRLESRAWQAVAHLGLTDVEIEAEGRRLRVRGVGTSERDVELLRQLHDLSLVESVVRPPSPGDGSSAPTHEDPPAERSAPPAEPAAPEAAKPAAAPSENGTEPALQALQREIDAILAEGPIRFHKNAATLTAEGRERVSRIARILARNPEVSVRVTGHTDSLGPAEWNLELSRLRAVTVRDLLATVVAGHRLLAEGRGSAEPVASNDSAAGRDRNRRIEVEVQSVSMQ